MHTRNGEHRTLEQLLLAAREDERRRCARELHDETLQSLAALRVQLAAASRSDDVDALQSALQEAAQEIGREIGNIRSLITELRPAALDALGLTAALDALFDRAFSAYGLRVQSDVALDGDGDERLHPDLETTVYRVVQEALTNASRHAGARRVQVMVHERGGEVVIAIVDDGCGFDTGGRTDGFGLTGMRERVALAGGELEIRSSADGTGVRATLPVQRVSADRARKLAYS